MKQIVISIILIFAFSGFATDYSNSSIDNVKIQIKAGRDASSNSVLIKGQITSLPDKDSITSLDHITISYAGHEWHLPVRNYDNAQKSEKKNLCAFFRNKSNSIFCKNESFNLNLNTKNGKLRLKVSKLEFSDPLNQTDSFSIDLGENVFTGTVSSNPMPLSLLMGISDSLKVDNIRYGSSPIKAAYKRIYIHGRYSSDEKIDLNDTDLTVTLGSFEDTITFDNETKAGSDKYIYKRDLKSELTICAITAWNPVGIYITNARIDTDKCKFQIIADAFIGNGNSNLPFSIITDNNKYDFGNTFGLQTDGFNETVATKYRLSLADNSRVSFVNSEDYTDAMLANNYIESISDYQEFTADGELIISDIAHNILGFTIGPDAYLDNIWDILSDTLGEHVNVDGNKNISSRVEYGQDEDTYYIESSSEINLTISQLQWPNTSIADIEYKNFTIDNISTEDEEFMEHSWYYMSSVENIITADLGENSQPINIISIEDELDCFEDQKKQVYDVPLNNGSHSLVLIFPKDGTELIEIEDKLINMPDWLNQLERKEVSLAIPQINNTDKSFYIPGLTETMTSYINTNKATDRNFIEYNNTSGSNVIEASFDLSIDGISMGYSAYSDCTLKAIVDHRYYNDHYYGVTIINIPTKPITGHHVPILSSTYTFDVDMSYYWPFIYAIIDNQNGIILAIGRNHTLTKTQQISLSDQRIADGY